jgi:hypothetical protein
VSVFFAFGAFLALSGSATLGYFLAALLCASKIRDLEAAYMKLAVALSQFLSEIPDEAYGIVVLTGEDICQMRRTLEEAEQMAGIWTSEDYRR